MANLSLEITDLCLETLVSSSGTRKIKHLMVDGCLEIVELCTKQQMTIETIKQLFNKYSIKPRTALTMTEIVQICGISVEREHARLQQKKETPTKKRQREDSKDEGEAKSGQCVGRTDKGTRCSRRAEPGSKVCFQHEG